MSGISALGTTYNLPNYSGILHALTPADTPFFSSIGGLSGGGQTVSTEFEWQTFDLRDASQATVVEGADAPAPQNRVRAGVSNVVQIHHETVGVAYSKIAAVGQKAGVNNTELNPVTNELDWQVSQMLTQMASDIEFSFINGVYRKPSDNSTARRTRGIRQAAGNRTDSGTVVGTFAATATDEKLTLNTHGLSNGDRVYIPDAAAADAVGLSSRTVYYVVNKSTNDLQVALTSGGSAVNITADGNVIVSKIGSVKPTPATIGQFLQKVYDAGGIRQSQAAALLVSSTQKLAITTEYANAYVKSDALAGTRNVCGVDVQTIVTDFGTLNVILSRNVPAHEVVLVSLDQCRPVYLEVPGKGHFFAEPLAKTGANDKTQLYGEVGLAYGNANAHGVLTGLAI